MGKKAKNFLTVKIIRWLAFFNMFVKIGLGYFRIVLWLLFNENPIFLKNFLLSKLFVPRGEGANLVFFNLYRRLTGKIIGKTVYPRSIEIEITTECRMNCVICERSYWTDDFEKDRNMTFDNFRRIINQFSGLLSVGINGLGSFFLNKDYLEMVSFLRKQNIMTYVVDNFNEITPQIMERLIDLPVAGVYISLNAARENTYKSIHSGGNYKKVLDNIRMFLELKKRARFPYIEVNYRYVVTKDNINEISDFLGLVNRWGGRRTHGIASRIIFSNLLTFPGVDNLSANIPQHLLKEVYLKSLKYDLFVVFSQFGKKMPVYYCSSWIEPYIMVDGHVLPCCEATMSNRRSWLRNRSFGNIFEQPFVDIWNSSEYSGFRNRMKNNKNPDSEFCTECRFFSLPNC